MAVRMCALCIELQLLFQHVGRPAVPGSAATKMASYHQDSNPLDIANPVTPLGTYVSTCNDISIDLGDRGRLNMSIARAIV